MTGGPIEHRLIERIRARLADEWRRTGNGDWQRTPLDRRRKVDYGSHPLFGALFEAKLADMAAAAPALKPIEPLSERAIAKVEASLGMPLPPALRQLYAEVGDGGFGPFAGLRRLANWAKDYRALLAEPIGQRRRAWPAALLPIVYLGGPRLCVDRTDGSVVLWTKPPSRASDATWRNSFVPQAPSLQAWLEAWIDTPTEAEGGPVGGWTPPPEEAERRAAVERADAARIAAAMTRPVAIADLEPLSDDLVRRIAARAADPARRTYLASLRARAVPLDVERLVASMPPGALPPQLTRVAGLLGPMMALLGKGMAVAATGPGSTILTGASDGAPAGPADEAKLAAAERTLGFALPRPLRQLYAIADGGFGPGDAGLFGLTVLTRRYRALTGTPQGPAREAWPTKLLPLFEEDPALTCLDLETGRITVYDPERMDGEASRHWKAAFVPGEASLALLMERWLASPTVDESRRTAG